MPQSTYIHIPFCKKKCPYCDFISFNIDEFLLEQYILCLKKQIKKELKEKSLKTIYFGGGTPSLLKERYFEEILSCFNEGQEVTVEINPESASEGLLRGLKSLGVNRLSIGIQSFNDDLLKKIGRIHSSKEAIKTIETAREAGFENISIDLMYSLPFQDMKLWKEDLKTAVSLNIGHISAYGLKIEEGTPFGRKVPENIPDDDLATDMWYHAIDFLEEKGFKHYEISNFAKPSFESQHNVNYWQNGEYHGFGLAAHGYVDGIRYSNTRDLQKYLENPFSKEHTEKISFEEMIKEAIFLGLRLSNGISIKQFKEKYYFDIMEFYQKEINKHIENGFMTYEEDFLKLTKEGRLLSNSILADFV